MGVQRAIEGASFISAVDGETRGFESLCFKPIDGEGCLVESPSQYWLNDPVLLAGDPSPSLTAIRLRQPDRCIHRSRRRAMCQAGRLFWSVC